MQAIILAGGKGTRLRPFTNTIPKPLIPIGDMPILEVILRQLKHFGFTEVILAINHLAHFIQSYFEDGSRYGLRIRYSVEREVLGTAGPLKLLSDLDDTFLIMNGDLLTTIDFSHLFNYHKENECEITIAYYKKEYKIDFGVLQFENSHFLSYIEKPTYSYDVSTGIYVINKCALSSIPEKQKYDMPNLILERYRLGEKIQGFYENFDWLDIGKIEDYETAVDTFEANKNKYLL